MVGVVELVALLKMCGRYDVAVMVVFCCYMRVVIVAVREMYRRA